MWRTKICIVQEKWSQLTTRTQGFDVLGITEVYSNNMFRERGMREEVIHTNKVERAVRSRAEQPYLCITT